MTSVRTKLFLNISLLVIFFVFMSWGLSTLILEPLYISQKKHSVIENSQIIDAIYQDPSKDISMELEVISSKLGAGIIILGQDGSLKFSSFARLINQATFGSHSSHIDNPAIEPPPPPQLLLKSREEIDGKSVLTMEQDLILNINFMVLKRELGNSDILVIRLPLAAVSESASYASNFMAFTGIISILVGCIWAFVFAKRFTVPLLELSNVAQGISHLDFSQKCTVSGNDEVGNLANSINNLSFQLSKAITELSQKNQALHADVLKERRLDKLRRNFISSVSHELKTPISLILGYAEGLKENVPKDEESKNYYCIVISDEANRMDSLIKDLLNLSQIESGFFHLEKINFDLSTLIDDIVLKYCTVLLDKQISLQLKQTPQTFVSGDVLRIEQVIVNLLNNAIDHVANSRIIRISIIQNTDKIRVYVYNTGKHIPEDKIADIWLSFYKVDQARTRELGGYGLGLSIVRAIQELHGNGYGVKNVEGGVLFWFELNKAV